MSERTRRRVTAVALVVLVATVPVLWQVGDVRATFVREEQRQNVVGTTVHARHTTNDYDGDGIPDASDACPRRPETQNGFRDADGCPDSVASTGAS